MNGAPQYADEIAKAFKTRILTAKYCANLPLYVIHAIHEAFPDTARRGFIKKRLEASRVRTSPLLFSSRFAVYEGDRIDELTRNYAGLWDVIRYAHLGNRVVRAVLEITAPDEQNTAHPFRVFTIHFRTNDLTGKPDTPPYVTDGCVLPLNSELHMMFLGSEGKTGYPLTIVSKITPSPQGVAPDAFDGIVQRRHHRNDTMFAMPVEFSRTTTMPIEKFPSHKLGSWPEEKAIEIIEPDIPNIRQILERLRRRRRHEGRGALIAGDRD